MADEPSKTSSESIDLGPISWRACLDVLLLAYREGTAEGKRMAYAELVRMAKAADTAVEQERTPS
jgi:hypothetical protein